MQDWSRRKFIAASVAGGIAAESGMLLASEAAEAAAARPEALAEEQPAPQAAGAPPALQIDPNRTALLIMDYQYDVIAKFNSDDMLLLRAVRVLERARAAHIPVIHVVIWFRPGYPELPKQTMFSELRASGRQQEGKPGSAIHSAVAPRAGEVTVVRRRVGAFSCSDLQCVLSGYGRNHLVMFGITTSGVVLSTVRAGADLDYQMTLIGDCCSDGDAEVHRVLTEKVFPGMAPVVSAAEFMAALAPAKG